MLDVVAVDPQEQHVAEQVHEPAVQEQRHEQVPHVGRAGFVAVGEHEEVVGAQLLEHLPQRHAGRQRLPDALHVDPQRRVVHIGALQAHWQGDERVDRDVGGDQQVGDRGGPARVWGVAQRQQHGRLRFYPVGVTDRRETD